MRQLQAWKQKHRNPLLEGLLNRSLYRTVIIIVGFFVAFGFPNAVGWWMALGVCLPWGLLLTWEFLCSSGRSRGSIVWLMGATLLWYVAAGIINGGIAALNKQTIWRYWLVFFYVCLLQPEGANSRTLKRELDWISAAAVIPIALATALGIYCARTGVTIELFDQAVSVRMYMEEGRLWLFGNPNTGGAWAAVAMFFALYQTLSGNRVKRVAYRFALALLYVSVVLTQCTSARFAVSLALGWLGLIYMHWRLRRMHPAVGWGVAFASALLVAIVIFCMDGPVRLLLLYNRNTAVHVKSYESLVRLSGRTEIWKSAFATLRARPRILLTGVVPRSAIEVVAEKFPNMAAFSAGLHNSYLELLFESGVIGLALWVAVMLIVGTPVVRWCFGAGASSRNGVLSAVVVACLIMAMSESLYFFSFFPQNIALFLCAGYCLYFAQTEGAVGLSP